MPKNDRNSCNLEPCWFKDAVIYQLHVKSFLDSNGDGIGDFNGLTAKLDYLESLGITAIWLLPFYPSPLRDEGYDISDYYGIHPAYGTISDFKRFLKEAHKRKIRVVTELVLNHTSDQHAWFQAARSSAPGSYWREFYVWSNTPDRYKEVRIIFNDFESSNWSWDPVAGAYYWHRFYAHQPDLNYCNPHVHQAIFKVVDYWMGLGVDGMRLDAVPYLYEQEGTSCENLPETFAFLKKLRAHIDQKYPHRMLLAEANQWPEDAAAYYGDGDMCHMVFHFPLMPRMFMALRMEDRFPVIDILEQTPQIPATTQWATFLRNHDELTLEMVTEEERDFMYRAYARDPVARINSGIRRRLAPLMQNSRRRIEVLNILLFSLPGTPIIYYGDEIGMGDNHFLGDRNGVRTPMQWSMERNAGFSTANSQRLYLPVIIDPEYNYQTVNVENEEENVSSLLWWMRRVIAMRKNFLAFARGSFEPVQSDNASVLTFIRKYDHEIILVIVNLSRFCQVATLDLSAYAGYTPYDLFSTNRFPRITDKPYVFTMGFHDYFWFQLKHEKTVDLLSDSYQLPELAITQSWLELFDSPAADSLMKNIIPAYLQQRTTAGCKSLPIAKTEIIDKIQIKKDEFKAVLLIIKVAYTNGDATPILLPLSADREHKVNKLIGNDKGLIMASLKGGFNGLLYDCSYHAALHAFFLRLILRRRKVQGQTGMLTGQRSSQLSQLIKGLPSRLHPAITVLKTGKRNTSFSYNNKLVLKLFRRLTDGVNPDIELHKALSEKTGFAAHVAKYWGAIDFIQNDSTLFELGLLTSYVHNTGSAWSQAIDAVSLFFDEVLASKSTLTADTRAYPDLFGSTQEPVTSEMVLVFGPFIHTACLLGTRTAELHLALLKKGSADFGYQAFTQMYQRSLYQSLRNSTRQTCNLIRKSMEALPQELQSVVRLLLEKERDIVNVFALVLKNKLSGFRARIHGDLRLGQFMAVGNDFVVKDFEGNPCLNLNERRLKRSPFKDVATMLNSFHEAAYYTLGKQILGKEVIPVLEAWAEVWSNTMCNHYLAAYMEVMEREQFIPENQPAVQLLISFYLVQNILTKIGDNLQEGVKDIAVYLKAAQKYLTLLQQFFTEQ